MRRKRRLTAPGPQKPTAPTQTPRKGMYAWAEMLRNRQHAGASTRSQNLTTSNAQRRSDTATPRHTLTHCYAQKHVRARVARMGRDHAGRACFSRDGVVCSPQLVTEGPERENVIMRGLRVWVGITGDGNISLEHSSEQGWQTPRDSMWREHTTHTHSYPPSGRGFAFPRAISNEHVDSVPYVYNAFLGFVSHQWLSPVTSLGAGGCGLCARMWRERSCPHPS